MSTRTAPEGRALVCHPTRALSSLGAALGVALLPKCPLCIAAWLAGFGLSASAAHAAGPFVRPAAYALASLTLLALMLGFWQSRTQRPTPRPCCDRLNPRD